MKRNQLISPQALSRLLQEAGEAWGRQDYTKTLELLERARGSDPANIRLLLDLARAYGLRYEFSAAEGCFERAVKLAPHPAEMLAEAGRLCMEFGNEEMARNYFERACREQTVSLSALLSVAELNERRNHLAEAGELLARAATVAKGDPRVELAEARLEKLRGNVERAELLLRQARANAAAEEPLLIQAGYDLAAVLDRMGRYDEAMTALLDAKKIQSAHAAPYQAQLQMVQARIQEMEKSMSAEVLARWHSTAKDLLPEQRFALLAGHPRSGTTLLEQMLDAHPDITSAEETQMLHDEAYLPLSRGFPQSATMLQVLDSASPDLLRRMRSDYRRYLELYLRKSIGSKLLIDKNPSLTVLIPAVARLFPEAKFLIALRDPRDVCVSCFMQHLGLNPVSSAYLTVAGTLSQYASVMGFWNALRPRMTAPSLEVRYEQLTANPQATARQTLEFLGVNWDEKVLGFDAHARSKHVKSPSYGDVVKPVYKTAVGRWRNYQRYLEPHLDKLTPLLKAFGYE